MAIYARPRPTTGIKALGCLCALATIGLSALYPFVLFGASWTLWKGGSLSVVAIPAGLPWPV